MTVKEDLIAAREHLARVGLHKGSLFKSDLEEFEDLDDVEAPCCGYGAVALALRNRPMDEYTFDYGSATEALDDASPALIFPNFNDAPETTLADVLAVFDKAIEAQP